MKRNGFAVLMVALLAVSSIAGIAGTAMAAEAPNPIDDPDELNYDASTVPNPEVAVTVSKDVHKVGQWAANEYEGDNGELKKLDAVVNESKANPVSLVATDINFSDASEFPRNGEDDNTASALDASEYTKTGSNSSKLTVSDTTTAPNVGAVRIYTDGSMASGDVAVAKYGNFSIDSDEAKRYIQLAVDVNTLDSGTHAEYRIVDADGDYKTLIVDPDNKTSSANVLANSTGDGFVSQQQLGSLTTHTVSGSDGTFDNIESVKLRVTDGDLDASFSLVNVEKTGKYKFGEQKYDGSDDDSEKDETRSLYEPNGRYDVTSFSSLGNAFDGAEVHNGEVAMLFKASALDKKMDSHVEFTMAGDFPNFEYVTDVYYRLKLPSAYDLSYSGTELRDTVELPGSRYQTVEIAEGVSDTDFSDISSWSSVAGKYDNQGANVTLDSTVQPGQQIAIHYEYPVTKSGQENMMASSGGGAGQFASDSGFSLFGFNLEQWLGGLLGVFGIGAGGKMIAG